MRVERFSLFFPPLLAKVRRGETEYAIGADAARRLREDHRHEPRRGAAPEVGPRPTTASRCGSGSSSSAPGRRSTSLSRSSILWALFWADGGAALRHRRAWPSSAAALPPQVLQPGDLILSIDGAPAYEPDQSTSVIEQRLTALTAAVASRVRRRRDHRRLPRREPDRGRRAARRAADRRSRSAAFYDSKLKRMRLGFSFGVRLVAAGRPGRGRGSRASSSMWNVTTLTVDRPGQDLRQLEGAQGRLRRRRLLRGDAAVVRRSTPRRRSRILALISLSLGVINLFPFLPLDGGHIFWAIAEKMPRPADPVRGAWSAPASSGSCSSLLLFVIGLSNDIGRITSGEGFGVR